MTWLLWTIGVSLLTVFTACAWLTIATLIDARKAQRVQRDLNRPGR